MDDYNEWLNLTECERDKILQRWDIYAREGFKFALMASARLAFELKCRILNLRVFDWHGSEWQIAVFVPDLNTLNDHELIKKHEGFPVLWFDDQNITNFVNNQKAEDPLSQVFRMPER